MPGGHVRWILGGSVDDVFVSFTTNPSKQASKRYICLALFLWLPARMSATIETRCCIAGGGPAGMMTGYLLARMGVDVVVLEKHKDFLRDFRGDTIHPSTLELMHELGVLDEFLKRPHQKVTQISAQIGDHTFILGEFSHLPTQCKFIALMPQWDFLNFIAAQAQQYSGFHLMMQAEVVDLVAENNQVVGVISKTQSGMQKIRAHLTIGADGRHSAVRERAGLQVQNLGAPMDVLWMRVSRHKDDPSTPFGRVEPGRMLVLIDRDEYWQCAFLIPKGTLDTLKQRGFENFLQELVNLAPFLRDRVHELRSWDDTSVLTVAVDRLREWSKPGLLCIGDAAHAMSPVGGVGINLAIQDAVAAANILGRKLLAGRVTPTDLIAVQRRRQFPTRATQRLQVFIQNRVIRRVLGAEKPIEVPWIVKLLQHWPYLQRIPARIVGMGFRPEHIRTPASAGLSARSGIAASL
jgi:2-polyprenyl-6-methoxyphenol hydroxylase-like FAD-dependent oxidoreductase